MQAQTKDLPKETPTTTFGTTTAPGEQDPMRNFGYTVAAYSVLWAILVGFVIVSWRRQASLDARIADVENAVREAAKKAGGLAMPSPAHVIFIPGALLIGMVIGYIMGARAVRAEVAKKRVRQKE